MTRVEENNDYFMFVIRKIHSAYLVTGRAGEIKVEPLFESRFVAACSTISTTMQLVGNSKLVLFHPENPCEYLKEYFHDLGWTIQNAD